MRSNIEYPGKRDNFSYDKFTIYQEGYQAAISDSAQVKITRRQVNAGLSIISGLIGGGIVYAYELIKNVDTNNIIGIDFGEIRDPGIINDEKFYQDDMPGDAGAYGFSRIFDPTRLSQISDNIGPDANCVLSTEQQDENYQKTTPQVIFNNGTSLKIPYFLHLPLDGVNPVPLIALDCYPTEDKEFETITFRIEQVRGDPEKSNVDTTRRLSFKPDFNVKIFEHRDGDLAIYKETQAFFPDRLKSIIYAAFARVPLHFQTCYLRDNKWSLNGKLYTISENGSPVIGESLGYLDNDESYYHILALWGEFLYQDIMGAEGAAKNSLGSFVEIFSQIQEEVLTEQDIPTDQLSASTRITPNRYYEIFYELDAIFKPHRDPSLDRYIFDDPREEFGRLLAIMMQDPDRIFDLQDYGNRQTKQSLPQLCGGIWNVVYNHLAQEDSSAKVLPEIFLDPQSQITFSSWSRRIY